LFIAPKPPSSLWLNASQSLSFPPHGNTGFALLRQSERWSTAPGCGLQQLTVVT
jgi:hypothetical protein